VLGSVVPLIAVHFARVPATAAQEAAGTVAPYVLDHSVWEVDVYRGVWWLGVALTAIYVVTALSATGTSGPLQTAGREDRGRGEPVSASRLA
jgi:hypothetical protein